jgi:hypothetical protein
MKPATFTHFKDGTTKVRGYIYQLAPDHPRRSKHGYVAQHRLVMEKKIGRYLLASEHVHHKNHVRHDNRPDNLELLDGKEHNRRHALKNGLGKDRKDYRFRNAKGQFK